LGRQHEKRIRNFIHSIIALEAKNVTWLINNSLLGGNNILIAVSRLRVSLHIILSVFLLGMGKLF
jgi:hypothetical protein